MMRFIRFLFLVFGIFSVSFGACQRDEDDWVQSDVVLFINEVMASNEMTVQDDTGVFSDWVEIYNPGTEAVDLSGYYIYDSGSEGHKYALPAGTIIGPLGYLVIWCDDRGQGLHADFRLSASGDAVWLEDTAGHRIDSITFEEQVTDVSLGRAADGGNNWITFSPATPGVSNSGPPANQPPVISEVSFEPQLPTPDDVVAVTAQVQDLDSQLVAGSVFLSFTVDGISDQILMTPSLSEPDMFLAELPAFADGKKVNCSIVAEDEQGAIAIAYTYNYYVHQDVYQPPTVFINELLAINDSVIQDPDFGEYGDWFELYNAETSAVDLSGMFVSDSNRYPDKWEIPSGTIIPAGGFLLFYADRQNVTKTAFHTNFGLSGGSERIGLFGPEIYNLLPIDTVKFDAQTPDVSYGRKPNGSSNWTFFSNPTPGNSN